MNDPHVEWLAYEIRFPDDGFSVASTAPSLDLNLGDFECRIDAGTLTARPKVHFASAETAQAALQPLLEDWEAELELTLNRRMIFESPSTHIVDRQPTQGAVHHVDVSDTLHVSDCATAHIESSTWPGPPAGKIKNTALVGLLRIRRRDLHAGREKIPALAYWLLTQVEERFGGRQNAAKALAVSDNVLSTLGKLSSKNDPLHGRKVSGNPQSLTAPELGWLRTAFDAVLVRAAEADTGTTPPQPLLTMADLPAL